MKKVVQYFSATCWWTRALALGDVNVDCHRSVTSAIAQLEQEPYLPARADELRTMSVEAWKMADEALLKVHARVEKLIALSMAIAGLLITLGQVGNKPINGWTGLAIAMFLLAIVLLVIGRLRLERYTPIDFVKLVKLSCSVDPDNKNEWTYLMATNTHIAKLQCDVQATVLHVRMTLAAGMVTLGLLFFAISLG